MNKKIAVESKTPGRTQSINLFKCEDKEGEICVFVDLRKACFIYHRMM
jgi:GTP-binding protein EngB required for normal cell division